MAKVKLIKIEAHSDDEYDVTLELEGKFYIERFRILEIDGHMLATLKRPQINSDLMDNGKAINEAVESFHVAHHPERVPEPPVEPIDPEAWRLAEEDMHAALMRYAEEHSEAETLDLIKRRYLAMSPEEQRSFRSDLSKEDQASLDALIAEDQDKQ